MTADLIGVAAAYIAAVERDADPDTLGAFYHPDIVSEEMPNRLVPKGGVRDAAKLRQVNAFGRGMFSAQTYEIGNAIQSGDQVMLETMWTATLATALGSLRPGQVMGARSAQIFMFRDGLIWRHRSYDSFNW